MNKYYLQQNCRDGAPVRAGERKLQFEPVSFHAGNWWGVYYTDNEDIQKDLATVLNTQGVTEIDEEEFAVWAKKKGTQQTHTWVLTESVLDQKPPPSQGEKSVAVSAEDNSAPESDTTKEVTERPIEELLETEDLEEPTESPETVGSLAGLADQLGVSINKVRSLAKIEGNPGKSDDGYNIQDWQQFLNENEK
jgi:hypothetical protein